MNQKLTLLEFQKRFQSEADCHQALLEVRWPGGFICPKCEHDCGYFLNNRPVIQCAVCRHQASVIAGTIFHKTRIPLTIWFWIIYLVAQDKGGASAVYFAARLVKQLEMHHDQFGTLDKHLNFLVQDHNAIRLDLLF